MDLFILSKSGFSTFSTSNSVENVENSVYFPIEMNISHEIKGFRHSFIHIFPTLNVENSCQEKIPENCIFYVLASA